MAEVTGTIRFRFGLRPIERIRDPLTWYTLTHGWYFIELDRVELLRYSSTAARRFAGQEPAGISYYLARFREDLIHLAPSVLQPVPADLVDFIANDDRWLTEARAELDSDEADAAAIWYDDHVLDVAYLRHPPRIRAWRVTADKADTVTLAWRHRVDSDIQFAAPACGTATVTAESFRCAVAELNRSLLAAMTERVESLRQAPPPAVEVDVDALQAEHAERATWLERFSRPPEVDWAAVRAGVRQIYLARSRAER